MSTTKRDFGSFQASNVEELVSAAEENYKPPRLPDDLPDFSRYRDSLNSLPAFGHDMKTKHFFLEEECTFINHGAFGAVLKESLIACQRWQTLIERQPLRFLDRECLPHLVYVIRRLAKFVACDPKDLVLVPNVTTAINCVIKSMGFKQGDVIYCLNVTYGAVKKLLKHTAETTGAIVQEENITFPLASSQQIVETVRKTLKAGTRLAVFDHIPSNTAHIQPIEELVKICHDRNVPVLIDGAHALGTLPLNLGTLGADFYTSNAYKWFCSPKGCGFLHVAKQWKAKTRPLVVSRGWGSGFSSEFIWSGLRDYSPFLSLHTTLDFWEIINIDKVHQYNRQLLCNAVELLVKEWGTGLIAPLDMCGFMAVVELPSYVAENETKNYDTAEVIQNKLYHDHNIEVPVKARDGKLYVRISVHIYNDLADYQKLASAISNTKT